MRTHTKTQTRTHRHTKSQLTSSTDHPTRVLSIVGIGKQRNENNSKIYNNNKTAKDLIESGLGSVARGGDLVFLGVDKAAEDGEQLEVAGRSDVVVTTQLVQEARRVDRDRRVDLLTYRHLSTFTDTIHATTR